MRIKLTALLILLFSLPVFTPAIANDWGIPELMQALAASKTTELNYVETKYLTALDTPLVAEGKLASADDGSLEMEVYSPKWAQYLISDETFTIISEDKPPREIDIAGQPQLAAFSAAFRAVQQGDQTTLEQYYSLIFSGDQSAWTLDLKPLDSDLAKRIENIRLKGSNGDIAEITTHQMDGDRSEMRLTPVD